MRAKHAFPIWAAGALAGAINGLLGAGGGMILVPLLQSKTTLAEEQVFPASVGIMLPICIVSVLMSFLQGLTAPKGSLAYLAGAALGGIAAGLWGKKLPVKWLHRLLGALLLFGGVRSLC